MLQFILRQRVQVRLDFDPVTDHTPIREGASMKPTCEAVRRRPFTSKEERVATLCFRLFPPPDRIATSKLTTLLEMPL